jgi:hypothetical protein
VTVDNPVTYAREALVLKDNSTEVNEVWKEGPRGHRWTCRCGTWRLETNRERGHLLGHRNIVYFIKGQRLSWSGQAEKYACVKGSQ